MSDTFEFKDHELADAEPKSGLVRYELRPVKTPAGTVAEGLYSAWIVLDNPKQYNSYTTGMVKDVIMSFRRASNAHDVVAVVFTAGGDKAFCTGGNTKEYAEYYAGRPNEYSAYMRLFNDMVSAILACDKPVICRVNGMRIAGGQEIGMACDFTVSSDLANFGQAGPRHGSAPVGGSTDFLVSFVGVERAMWSCTMCEPWTAYQAQQYGLITEAVPVLKVDGEFVPNPMVVTDTWLERGQIVYGRPKTGEQLAAGKAVLKQGQIDLTPLDDTVDGMITKLLMTFPNCLEHTVREVRKHKLAAWNANKESSRAWLGLNMLAEAKSGFQAFNEGERGDREVNFVALRQQLARGAKWGPELFAAVAPKSAKKSD